MSISYESYKHIPFEVKAVEITDENIEEIATLIGEIEINEEGEKVIRTDKRVIKGFRTVPVGWFMSKVGRSFRIYKPLAFERTFELMPEVLDVGTNHAITVDLGMIENPNIEKLPDE